MNQFKNSVAKLILAGLIVGAGPLQAQNWLKAGGNFYTMPSVKVGIGTSVPQRNLEVVNTIDSYLRIHSIGGNQLEDQVAGIELKRSLFNGSTTTWSLLNESTFKIKNQGNTLFSLTPTIARLGTSVNDPLEFVIYGTSISASGNQGGALRLHSKAGNNSQVTRIDANQLESGSDFYINNIKTSDVVLVKGGGKVKIGTTDNGAKLGISSEGMQLKLINPGTQGGFWQVGVGDNSWLAGAGKLVFTNTNSTADATMVMTPSGSVGIGVTSPSRTLHVNGITRTNVLEIVGGADIAEPFEVNTEAEMVAEAGSVVVIDEARAGQLKLSRDAYDKKVIGIISGANGVQPGMVLSQEEMLGGGENVAISGRVYVRANASNGVIRAGDFLTTSAVPGEAMRVDDPDRARGAIIGKAMSQLDEAGFVLVFVSLQ